MCISQVDEELVENTELNLVRLSQEDAQEYLNGIKLGQYLLAIKKIMVSLFTSNILINRNEKRTKSSTSE